ncbi:acetyl-CoA carboxylase biotin carboxyl carrier protein [Melghiribacillus thermohalophilus]|uniref:Biotin carboxyl carrier protein of acetyl-CoA carboxylase n=1 Tax=Melghiribacillus thermohalophilus TaxID=1324956 RepID=A0A4V2V1V3_9BACI|nr:acetyl-CoA carboxylase biotin carboxyl carrier protein [Melghiribacillus thermohalophilus]TCT22622.1 acetyl-CoA carboxylase biotin carboxyl carrier protein [Melghiribacillus thermohalophilus]
MLKVQEIRELIKLIDKSSIDEFSYESNGTKVSMKKQGGQAIVAEQRNEAAPVEPAFVQEQKPAEPAVQKQETEVKEEKPQETSAEKKPAETKDYDHEITSPMVGTFYRAPSPDSDPYVEVGDEVKADTVVCIVEAMKLFNEIEAEVQGEIVEILVENGELVEYGQPLFRVKTK